jgi:hypothetical protein|nr:MAG TPA: hypothetical protein [Caudoviricetes sp.]
MERLTSPNINVDSGTDRFLHATIGGKEIDWKQSRDSTLNVLINGPTSNGFGKDIFRKMARDLYGRLKAYEDTGWTPEMLRKMGENAGHLWDFAQAAENMTVGRLKELAEADKDGRVVVLPCKVGDTVWFKTYKNNARDCIGVQPHEVTRISASIIVPGEIVDIGIPVDQIGVRVFLSETEAVAADAKPPAGNSILEV